MPFATRTAVIPSRCMTVADDAAMSDPSREHDVSRRHFLRLTTGFLAGVPLLRTLPARATPAETPAPGPCALWYPTPAAGDRLLFEGLPLGNGHLGALVGGNPAHDV